MRFALVALLIAGLIPIGAGSASADDTTEILCSTLDFTEDLIRTGSFGKADRRIMKGVADLLSNSDVAGAKKTERIVRKAHTKKAVLKALRIARKWCRDHDFSTATTTTTIPPTQPQVITGTGDSVPDVTFPGEPAVAHIVYNGGGNFAIWTYGATGERLDLIVNTIGGYDGFRPLNFLDGEVTTRLEISADGPWTVEIKPLATAHTANVPGHFEDRGDDVVMLVGTTDTAHFVNTGSSNFVVQAYGSTRELLVNEIGAYDGTVIVPSGAFVLEVTSDGAWTADFT